MQLNRALTLGLMTLLGVGLSSTAPAQTRQTPATRHTFAIGDKDFLLDGKPVVIRTGEMHFARVPREYWRHRLQLLKAMGMNAVCAYLFWNYHEFEPGKFNWSGQADAAEFCRIAQQEGMWVILRPGPYVCAEWDGGGLPWWLLQNESIRLRSSDPAFMKPATNWFKEVGRVLGPLQVTHGGPILMAQVENEYGSFGKDTDYMGQLRQNLIDAGFDVPLFACDPAWAIRNASRSDLFQVVNFGSDPENSFKTLRQIQPTGPLMSGEYYPGWFDTWGSPHHKGDTPRYLKELEYMLQNRASFSMYMAHGGTTFGMWPGTDRPFKPDTNSYDYDAPISEAGWIGEKFQRTRELMGKYLNPGETLPAPPAPIPVMSVPTFRLTQNAPLFSNLPRPVADTKPRFLEAYNQGQGDAVYRTMLPAGAECTLQVENARDFAWVMVDGASVGFFDRRSRRNTVKIPARSKPAELLILLETMGHVNFGNEIHDRKGIYGEVKLIGVDGSATPLNRAWQIYNLPLDAKMLAGLKWGKADANPKGNAPGFWRGTFNVAKPADTFLDLSRWGKGVIWVNGHCLARFWNIGPTQTAYLPGAWMKRGANQVIVLDLLGPQEATLAGLQQPILDMLRPELDFAIKATQKSTLSLNGVAPMMSGTFAPGPDAQEVKFAAPMTGQQFCLEMLNSHNGQPYAAIAELDLLDAAGQSLPHQNWKIAYASSEELEGEDGSASNAIDGQTANFWHSRWKNAQPPYPHQLVIDVGKPTAIGGFRYTPRAGDSNTPGRIKDYRVYVGNALAK
ncbi:beta-galactosidase [bacterium]|nr:MAG: beta-galactosidase [bacterium]